MSPARAALTIFCLAALAILLAQVSGAALGRADDTRALHFEDCNAQPCLLGIIPGATEWADASAALARYAPEEATDKRIIVRMPGAQIETYVSVNRHTVGRMYFNFRRDAPLSAAWVIQRYGAPCGVSIYVNGEMMTLRYPLLLANVRVMGGRFDLDAPVMAIHLSDPDFDFESQPDPCVDNITSRQMLNTRWQGFAPLSIYWRRGQS
jgi:hypothetical protein